MKKGILDRNSFRDARLNYSCMPEIDSAHGDEGERQRERSQKGESGKRARLDACK